MKTYLRISVMHAGVSLWHETPVKNILTGADNGGGTQIHATASGTGSG